MDDASGARDVAPSRPARDPQLRWFAILLGVAAGVGLIVSLLVMPAALPDVLAAAAVQAAVTLFALQAQRRPVTWAILVAIACLLSSTATPRLQELAMLGAATWIPLSIAFGSLALFRFATDRRGVAVGMSALGLASACLVVTAVATGVPVAAAVLSSSVPFLVGALVAVSQLLDAARSDRVSAPSQASPQSPAGMAAIRRSLAVITLRADELVARSRDDATRRAAADLREVARQALTAPREADTGVIEIRVATGPTSPTDGGAESSSTPARDPDGRIPSQPHSSHPADALGNREREILRLLSTGATNAAIARSIYLSEATVKQYVSRLMRRFDRANRTQLALLAAAWFWEAPSDIDDT